jgi:DinB family protein
MGMFDYATGILLRMPEFLGVTVRAGTTQSSTAQLEAVMDQVESVTRKARDLVSGRSVPHLTTSLEPASWSVAQCLDHLALTTTAVLPAISEAIVRAPHLTTNRALRTGALTRLLLRNLEPPYRLRLNVHSSFVPRQQDFNSAWDAFEKSQAQLAKTMRAAIGLAIDEVTVESPVYARLSYNVYGALRMLAAHERRHLWQIERILKTLDDAPNRAS